MGGTAFGLEKGLVGLRFWDDSGMVVSGQWVGARGVLVLGSPMEEEREKVFWVG